MALSLAVPAAAGASVFRVDARTEASVYETRVYRNTSADAPQILPHRKLVQYLGLDGYELVKDEDVGVQSWMRFFTDLGVSPRETQLLDGAKTVDVDLLYASVYWKNVGGLADLRFGRQIMVDELDYMPFDGLAASVHLPFHATVDVYGGLMVKGTSFLGTPTFQPDGVRESDERRLALQGNSCPASIPLSECADRALGALEPLYGARLTVSAMRWGFVRVGYRQALLLAGPDGTDPFGASKTRTDLQRLGAGLEVTPVFKLRLQSSLDYDLVTGALAQGRVGARFDQELFGVSAEVMRFAPILSADSIWNYFATGARDEVRMRFDYTPYFALHPFVTGSLQRYNSNLQDAYRNAVALSPDPIQTNLAHGLGAGVSLSNSIPDTRGIVDVLWRNGYGGRQLWANLAGGKTFSDIGFSVDGRVSFASIHDNYNPLLKGVSTGLQLIGGYKIVEGAKVSLLFEDNFGTFTKTDFRAYGILELGAYL